MQIKRPVGDLKQIKRRMRSELGKNLVNREVTWNDGEKILWLPFLMNLVHTTDNPSESALHLLMGLPEQQLMTRFMYPHPRLETLDQENEKFK